MSATSRHVVYRNNTSWEVWEHDGEQPIAVCATRADAELLVVAPQMLEALQLILKRAEHVGDVWYADEARAAIALVQP